MAPSRTGSSRNVCPWREAVFWWLTLGLAWALRLWSLDGQSLWRDEVDSVRFATQPLAALLRMFVTPGHNGPLYYLLLRPWALFFGHVDFALRYTAAWGGLLVLPLAYVVFRRWIGRGPARLTVLLLAASPYAIWYSQELRMYAWILALVLAATWCWQRALWDGEVRYWVPYVGLIAAGIYMHFLVALLIPTHLVMALLFPTAVRRRWPFFLLAYASFILPYLPLAWWQQKLLFSPTFRTGHPFVPWPEMVYRLLTVFSVGVHLIRPPLGVPALRVAPLLFLTFVGLFWPTQERPRVPWRHRVGLLLWFLLPTLGLYLISLELPLFTERYLIWTMPALYALAAWGAWALIRAYRWGLAAWGVVLVLFLVGLGYQVARPIKPDMRAAAAYVESHRQPDSVVLLHLGYLVHAYTYYQPESRPALREAPAPGPFGTLEETGREILLRVGPARDVWYVESESEMWDPKGLVRQWLDQHATVVERRDFVGVRVVHYRLP